MSELIWFNGRIMPLAEARVGVEDRGYQFADGVYEVIRIYNGRLFTLPEHLDRLFRSAADVLMSVPLDRESLSREIVGLVDRTAVTDGMVYLQLTRGCAPRNHVYAPDIRPTLLFYTRSLPTEPAPGAGEGAKLKTVEDERWRRCWIKSIALLPNILAKNAAVNAGADEAVFVEDGVVTECSASNVFAVIDGVVVTHPIGPKVLAGITRQVLLDLAPGENVRMIERPPRLEEIRRAEEVFITSTTREIGWVSMLDDLEISKAAGPITMRLHHALQRVVKAKTS